MKSVAIILFICFIFSGFYMAKYEVENTQLRISNDSLITLNKSNEGYIVVQSELINQLNNRGDSCKRCSKYPIYETRN